MTRHSASDSSAHPTFGQALKFWFKLGFISFGGPAGQIAIMHDELVVKKKWISESRFLHALNYCMLLPGPEAQQLATYVGWLLHKTRGGLAAGSLFVLPSVFILWLLSYIYVRYGRLDWVESLFYGLKPAVVAIVAAAAIRIGRKALRNEVLWSIAGLAFVALYYVGIPFPAVIAAAAVIGVLGGKLRREKFLVIESSRAGAQHRPVDDATGSHVQPSWKRAGKVLGAGLALWWLPIFAAGVWLGWNHTVFLAGIFFSKAALVTFGGAYAVLPYVAQRAVEVHGWLSATEMLDGLGLAETTPGPLIMVLQFVGFLAGWHQPAELSPLISATLAAAITTWATFVPCFIWIFLGAPYIEGLRGNERLAAALSAVTAAVVGVIFNLAVWFGLHVFFPPNGFDYAALLLTCAAFLLLLKQQVAIVPIVVGSALIGLVYRTVL